MPDTPGPDINSLDKLLKPRSVAIIGASNDPLRTPGVTLRYLRQSGFAGDIWPVNPTRDIVQGLRSYPSVADLPGAPDVAIIVVPTHLVRQAVQDCAARGVGAAMVFATGFGEAGAAGLAAQHELVRIAQAGNMRLLGPNCLGGFNSGSGFYGTLSISLESGLARPGNVAVVSQSGAYGEQMSYLARKRGIDVRYFLSTGNEADIDGADAISWLAGQPDIDVIIAYAEGATHPERFVAALAAAQAADKRVIFMKVGRSSAGAAAAASHTASLAGDDRIWDAVFHKYGVFRAQSSEEQIDVAYAAARGILPSGRNLGILTVSGGFGIQLCDAASVHGLEVGPLPKPAAETLLELLPFGSIQNPLDASGQIVAHLDRLKATLDCLACDAGYDAVVTFLGSIPLAPQMAPVLLGALQEAGQALGGRLLVLCCVADDAMVRSFEEAGYLVFSDATNAVRAIAALVALAEGRSRRSAPAGSLLAASFAGEALSEFASKRLLAAAGLPVPAEHLATSAEAAVAAAEALGFPVAMKICSPVIVHKTEIGGVLLGVSDAASVRAGFETLMLRAQKAGFAAGVIEGVIVTRMSAKGIETILGVKIDPVFGPAVLFGLGGIHAEILKDVSLRLAPVDLAEAHSMIRDIRAWPLLEGARGAAASDVDALAASIVALSCFAAANAHLLSSIDINPLVVWDAGKGAAVLDAFLEPAH